MCELTGVGPQFGNNVSHSNRKTRKKFLPNIQNVSFVSEITKLTYRFRVIPSALKTVEKNGGIDNFLIEKSLESKLSKKALQLKNLLKKNIKNQETKAV